MSRTQRLFRRATLGLLFAGLCAAPFACSRELFVGMALNNDPVTSRGGAGGTGGTGGMIVGGTGGSGAACPRLGTAGVGVAMPSCPTISTTPGTVNACGRTVGIAYSPDGQLVATSTQGPGPNDVHIWRLSDGALVREFSAHGPDATYSVAFSPDGTMLATAGMACSQAPAIETSDPTEVKLWSVSTGDFLRQLPVTVGFYADSAVFSHDGTRVVTAGAVGPIQIWNASDGALLTSISTTNTIYSARFSPDDARIVGASTAGGIWNASNGALVHALTGGEDMNDAAYSPDGSHIMMTGPSGDLSLLDASGNVLQTFHAHDVNYTSRVVWVGNTRVISDDWGGNVKSWTLDSAGHVAASGSWSLGSQTLGMAVSPDGSRLAVAADAGFVFLAL